MITFPTPKINLGLNIISKREDGYHDINTIFIPLKNLFDILEVIPFNDDTKKDRLTISGLDVPCISEDNLCLKAVKLMRLHVEIPPLNIFLHKIIPFGAGLGGGSSDAAFMLKLLNEMFKAGFDENKLEKIASEIGADCPFFIKNQITYAEEIGNVFSDLEFTLPSLWIEFVVPPIHVSTAFAYKNIIPHPPKYNLKNAIFQPVDTWKNCILNDFESAVFKKYPELNVIKEKLYKTGAIYASMSGSGSAIFGLFREKPEIYWEESYFIHSELLNENFKSPF